MAMTERAGIPYGPRWRERRPGPTDRPLITRAGAQALREELARLRQELEVEFPERLREAFAFGEVANNDDYLQIKEEEAVVASRIRQLETVLATAHVVGQPNTASDRVAVGSTVQVEDVASGGISEHVLTRAHEWLAPTDISANSPMGRALLGREIGDEVTVDLPSDRAVILRIKDVR